jgi:hypothetical protein
MKKKPPIHQMSFIEWLWHEERGSLFMLGGVTVLLILFLAIAIIGGYA